MKILLKHRFDENFSRELTKIKYLTEGILIRELMGDPLLNSYSAIILDEVKIILLKVINKKILNHMLTIE